MRRVSALLLSFLVILLGSVDFASASEMPDRMSSVGLQQLSVAEGPGESVPAASEPLVAQGEAGAPSAGSVSECEPGSALCARVGERGESIDRPISPLSRSSTGLREAEPAIVVPEWCAANVNQGTLYTLTSQCATSTGTVTSYNTTGTPLGGLSYYLIDYSYTSTTNAIADHYLELSVSSVWGTGGTISVDARTVCGSCSQSISYVPAFFPVVGAVYKYVNQISFTGRYSTSTDAFRANYAVPMNHSWSLLWRTAGQNAGTYPGTHRDLCDNSIPSKAPGCTKANYIPFITYSRAALPEFTRHVDQALASGLPGGSPEQPLTRTMDESIVAANRSTSCPSIAGLPRPDGKDCDEFPFASSREGGSSNAQWGMRTFSGCEVPSTYPRGSATGAKGFSICMISLSENRSAGASLGNWYKSQRVVEGRVFYVKVVA